MDPRIKSLEDASAKAIVDTNYDPHFSGVRDRAYHESLLFLARFDALMDYYRRSESGRDPFLKERIIPKIAEPIPMILFCPSCGLQHVDAEEDHKPGCVSQSGGIAPEPCDCNRWTNPSHMSHLCHGCGHVWRPADVATTGVSDILTRGGRDSPLIRVLRFPRWRHKKSGRIETEIGRGRLQKSGDYNLGEGARLVAYRDADNALWFRWEPEFDDGRFKPAEGER